MPSVTFSYGETLPSAITNGDIKVVTTNGTVFFDIGSTRIQFKDSTKLSLSGGTMSGPINMNSNKITSLATPTASTDAANKSYVDSKLITYKAGTAISISDSTISHSNIGTANTYGPGSNATLSPGSAFYVPQMTTNAQGHVSSAKNVKFTLDSSILRTSNIANNLTTTSAGYALDARQGRSLNSSISSLKSSKNGDTMRGNLNFATGTKILFESGATVYSDSSQHIYIAGSNGESEYFMHHGVHDSRWTWDPDVSLRVALGTPNHRFTGIFSQTSVDVSSDRNDKHDIKSLNSSKYEKLFSLLKPVSFIYNENESNRTHLGLIAQDVEDALSECEIDSQQFAAFCKANKRLIHKYNGEEYEEVLENEYTYSLRYSEFIPLLIHMVQLLGDRVDALESIVSQSTDN